MKGLLFKSTMILAGKCHITPKLRSGKTHYGIMECRDAGKPFHLLNHI